MASLYTIAADRLARGNSPVTGDTVPLPTDGLPSIGEIVHYVGFGQPIPGRVYDMVCLPAIVVDPCSSKEYPGLEPETGLAVLDPTAESGVSHRSARHADHSAHDVMTWHRAHHA